MWRKFVLMVCCLLLSWLLCLLVNVGIYIVCIGVYEFVDGDVKDVLEFYLFGKLC